MLRILIPKDDHLVSQWRIGDKYVMEVRKGGGNNKLYLNDIEIVVWC